MDRNASIWDRIESDENSAPIKLNEKSFNTTIYASKRMEPIE